jgi:hypothetical protein
MPCHWHGRRATGRKATLIARGAPLFLTDVCRQPASGPPAKSLAQELYALDSPVAPVCCACHKTSGGRDEIRSPRRLRIRVARVRSC